jgi:hypothetical protein
VATALHFIGVTGETLSDLPPLTLLLLAAIGSSVFVATVEQQASVEVATLRQQTSAVLVDTEM